MKKYLLLVLTSAYFIVSAQLTPIQPLQDIDAFTSIFVNGETIVLSSDKSKILKSIDGGVTWVTITNNVPQGINKLYSPSQSIIFGCGNDGVIIKSIDFGDSWTAVNSGSSANLFDITSVNSYTLFACGAAGTILRSTDGGNSWISVNPIQANINSIKFSSPETGWAACDYGIILRTLDGGTTWARVPGASAECNFAVVSTFGLDGIFVFGREGQVIASTNGGVDWKYDYQNYYMVGDTVIAAWHYTRDTVVYADDRGALSMVVVKPDRLAFGRFGSQYPLLAKYIGAFRTDDKMFYVAGSGPNLSKAFGSGNGWISLIMLLKGKNLKFMKFADDKVGMVCDFSDQYYYSESAVYVTTDAGANWRYAKTGTRLRNLQALSPEKLYISEMFGWMSRDSGKTWTRKNNANGSMRDMIFLDSLNGYCLTYYTSPVPGDPKGRLFKTTNGGYSWTQLQIFESWSVWDIYADKDGRMWISQGVYGEILVSNDGGANLSAVNIWTNAMPVGANIGGLGYIVFGDGKIAYSGYGGVGFSLKYNDNSVKFNGVSNRIGGNSIVVGNGGKILATTDYGITWQTLPSGTTLNLTSVWLMPDLSFIVGTSSGEVFKGERPGIFTDVENENIELPVDFTLGNYPNPFNGSTIIHFTLPADSECKLEVFSPIGSQVFEADIKGLRGNNSYNFDATSLNSGVYLYRLNAGGKSLAGKMILLK